MNSEDLNGIRNPEEPKKALGTILLPNSTSVQNSLGNRIQFKSIEVQVEKLPEEFRDV
jgi:hypothetical protein